uniref:Uncharacterized protein n=1 Tax=Trichuris muris TaxID=70415 RepID=A0A5S6QCD0_TRIMR
MPHIKFKGVQAVLTTPSTWSAERILRPWNAILIDQAVLKLNDHVTRSSSTHMVLATVRANESPSMSHTQVQSDSKFFHRQMEVNNNASTGRP